MFSKENLAIYYVRASGAYYGLPSGIPMDREPGGKFRLQFPLSGACPRRLGQLSPC